MARIDRNPTDINDTLGGRSARLTAPGGAVTEKFWSPIKGDYEYAVTHGLTRPHDQQHFAGLMLRSGGVNAVCMLPSGYYWTVRLTGTAGFEVHWAAANRADEIVSIRPDAIRHRTREQAEEERMTLTPPRASLVGLVVEVAS